MEEVGKVVCIDNTSDGFKTNDITLGKVYDSYNMNKYRIVIDNDKGVREWYNNNLFMSLEKWRETRLNQIGI